MARWIVIGAWSALALAACGGGGAALPPTPTADVVSTTLTPPSTVPPTTVPTAPASAAAASATTPAPTTTSTTVPPTTVPPTTVPPTTTTTIPTVAYQVVAGDTLVTIASRFGLQASQLAELNRLSDPRRLQIGQTLAIPVPADGATGATG